MPQGNSLVTGHTGTSAVVYILKVTQKGAAGGDVAPTPWQLACYLYECCVRRLLVVGSDSALSIGNESVPTQLAQC